MFEGRKVNDRIVSIDRYYVCPIVRGKETKSVKFGAKVNNIQIDGISFIEHLSFKAFNEGIRLNERCSMNDMPSICILLTFAPNSTDLVSLPLTMGRT